MISQRYRGLGQTLFLCQLLVVMATFGMAMGVSFAYFTGASTLHLRHYPIYAAVLFTIFGAGKLWCKHRATRLAQMADGLLNSPD